MRDITEIDIHHAAVTQHDIDKILPSFDRNHKERLTDPSNVRQPLGGGDYPNIAYHYIITPKETTRVRSLAVEGYHAGNYAANLRGVGICLSGNFDVEKPTESQMVQLEELVLKLKSEFPKINKVRGHRYYSAKSCPGLNFTNEMIDHFNDLVNGRAEPRYKKKEETKKEYLEGVPYWGHETIENAKRNDVSTDLRRSDLPVFQVMMIIEKNYGLKPVK